MGSAVTAEPVFGVSRPWFPAQVDLRVAPASASGRVDLPLEPNTASGPDPDVLWLGPDEWLFVCSSPARDLGGRARRGGADDARGSVEAAALVRELTSALAGAHHSAIDVSANRAAFDLSGRDRLEVLSKGCGLDLHRRTWFAGRCAQTLLARAPVILHERAATTRVLVRPSFVPYLDRWFAAAGPR
jgi:sarcosine oxidase, subunit gamma